MARSHVPQKGESGKRREADSRMGYIRTDVKEQHLAQHQNEEAILKPFLPGFFVTWGKRRKAFNTELSVYFLNPEPFMTEAFGFEQEVMLVYAPYSTIEPRSLQAAEQFMADEPARGRVERLTYILVSDDPKLSHWLHEYTAERQESRLIVPFTTQSLIQNANDAWYVRNVLSEYLYGRDLFDYRLPLERDTYFFGRADLMQSLLDATKRGENRGIFGLRKTGKTSLLYKLERSLKSDGTTEVFYYDCKLPSIRKLRWHELLGTICRDLKSHFDLTGAISETERGIAETFLQLVSSLPVRALLLFDEIEYISPLAIEDTHWRQDFISFWQTFWACQSRYRKISTLIAGVNPSVVEVDAISGIQNPLFGIVSYQFLTGLNGDDTRNMIRTLGKRMGLKFTPEAVDYVFARYGGHPLLTRIACSILNTSARKRQEPRPIDVTRERLTSDQEQRETELMFYCRHVVSELKQFYPDEYEMLELLACGRTHDFLELEGSLDFTKHLHSYGLLSRSKFGVPSVAVPVIGMYVALELARQEGRQTLYRLVPPPERVRWIERRRDSIVHDLRLVEQAIRAAGKPPLFGANSFPEADRFHKLTACESEGDFESFISVCNRCFVESIENYGKAAGIPKYYWQDIKTAYPGLWFALHRIKLYRHERLHLQLTAQASKEMLAYLTQDLEGRSPSKVSDLYFTLQQCVLDGLLTGLQIEVSRLT